MWVDSWMRLCIMILDMFKVSFLLESWNLPIQELQPLVNVRVIVTNHSNVTLEMLYVNRVESDNCYKESDISFSESTSDQVLGTVQLVLLQDVLHFVEVSENVTALFLIHILGSSEPSLVYTVVDVIVDQLVDGVDPQFQIIWIESDLLEFFTDETVELGVEHSDDL